MRSKVSTAGVVVGVTLALVIFGASVRSQEPPQDVLVSLLTEVRALRSAIEQMASSSARVQLAMGRLQIQEQRVTTLSRQLSDVRASLSTTERERNELE